MMLTTGLLFVAMHKVWRWPLAACLGVAGLFLIVDIAFFSANLLKIADGGWLPLTFGALVFFVMLTWRLGVDAVRARLIQGSEAPAQFTADLKTGRIPRVDGTAIFLTRTRKNIPPILIDQVRHMGALHRSIVALTVLFEETPRVEEADRGAIEPLAEGIWRVTLRFGFIEIPDLPAALKRLGGLDPSIDIDHAVYFATRDLVVCGSCNSLLENLRLPLFAFLYRNAVKAVDRFSLPRGEVVELAREIEI
jgi:KUP system potassium uptake protein